MFCYHRVYIKIISIEIKLALNFIACPKKKKREERISFYHKIFDIPKMGQNYQEIHLIPVPNSVHVYNKHIGGFFLLFLIPGILLKSLFMLFW